MKLNVITDDKGNLVAATGGPVGEPEPTGTQAEAEGSGGVVLLPGQTVNQIEVPDRLFDPESFDPDNPVQLRRHLTAILST